MKAILTLAQMTIQLGQPQRNFDLAAAAADEAAHRGTHLLVLPELWSTGYDLQNGHPHAHTNLHLMTQMDQLAKDRRMYIGGSLLLEGADGQLYNTFVLHAPEGSHTSMYQKIHLFRLMDEEKWLQPGSQLVKVPSPWGLIGLAICYDLRFPEMFRRLALEGVQMVLLPAEWPLRRIEHWKILMRARAIENQMFFSAVNTVGQIGDETFGGSSAIISPWGETLAEADSSCASLITAEIDLDSVSEVRSRIPIFADRRPDIY
jgi:omega-amidase